MIDNVSLLIPNSLLDAFRKMIRNHVLWLPVHKLQRPDCLCFDKTWYGILKLNFLKPFLFRFASVHLEGYFTKGHKIAFTYMLNYVFFSSSTDSVEICDASIRPIGLYSLLSV